MIPPTSKRALEIAAIHVIRIYQSAAFARNTDTTGMIADRKSKLTHSAFSSACSAACLCDIMVEFKTIPHPAQRQGVLRSRVRESCSASASAAATAIGTAPGDLGSERLLARISWLVAIALLLECCYSLFKRDSWNRWVWPESGKHGVV